VTPVKKVKKWQEPVQSIPPEEIEGIILFVEPKSSIALSVKFTGKYVKYHHFLRGRGHTNNSRLLKGGLRAMAYLVAAELNGRGVEVPIMTSSGDIVRLPLLQALGIAPESEDVLSLAEKTPAQTG
jgi:hypothetical protein